MIGDETPSRILLVAGRLDFRGPTAYTLNLVRGLIARGTAVKLVAFGGPFVDKFEDAGCPVEEVPFLKGRVADPFLMHDLVRKLDAGGWQVLHAIDWPRIPRTTKLARKLGRPAVATVHFTIQREGRLRVDSRWLRRLLVFTEAHREDLVNRHKVPKDLVQVVPNGIDIDRLEASCSRVSERSETPIIGFIGGLRRDAGLEELIRAAATLRDRDRELHLMIVGDGPDGPRLRRLLLDLDLKGRVTLVSTPLESHEVLPSFHVFCSPSHEGGVKQSLLDAMACARPVVTTAVGGTLELVQDRMTGLIVPPADPESLADAIALLLDHPETARRYGEAARDLVRERFDLELMVDLTLSAYAQACSTHAR